MLLKLRVQGVSSASSDWLILRTRARAIGRLPEAVAGNTGKQIFLVRYARRLPHLPVSVHNVLTLVNQQLQHRQTSYTGTGSAQNLHRVASRGISERHCGHVFTVTPAGGSMRASRLFIGSTIMK